MIHVNMSVYIDVHVHFLYMDFWIYGHIDMCMCM